MARDNYRTGRWYLVVAELDDVLMDETRFSAECFMSEHLTHLYGCLAPDFDALARRLAFALSLRLEARVCSHWGNYYLDRSGGFTECRLYRNADPTYRSELDHPEEFWFVPNHRDCNCLLVVDGLTGSVESFHASLQAAMPMFVLLRNSTYDTGE
jgi:hypothetical protein